MFSVTLSHGANNRKSQIMKLATRKNLGPWNTPEKNIWIHEMPTRKNFGPTKYPRQKILNQRNNHEKKFRTHEIQMRKISKLTKYSWKKFWTYEIPTMEPWRWTLETHDDPWPTKCSTLNLIIVIYCRTTHELPA